MPHIDHKGPEGKGSKTGRNLGNCKKNKNTQDFNFGEGIGKRRKSGGGEGLGKRLKSSKIFNNNN